MQHRSGSLLASKLGSASLGWPGDSGAVTDRHPGFINKHLALGAAGLASLTPFFAWRGSPSLADTTVAVSLAAPIAAAFVASRSQRLGGAYAVASLGKAGLVACLAASPGGFGPATLLWLAAEPITALVTDTKRSATAAALASGAALLVGITCLMGGLNLAVSDAAGCLAAAFLIGGSLLDLGWHARRPERAATLDRRAPSPDAGSAVLDMIGDVVTWHDLRGDVVAADGAARQLLGMGPAALAGDGLFRRVHVSDRPIYLKALNDVANGAGPATVAFRLQLGIGSDSGEAETPRRASRTLWVEMRSRSCDRTPSAPGSAVVVSCLSDASASRDHAEELEQTRRAAASANELKGRFLATVTHELRTPLNAIIGFSELLASEHPYVVTDERRREYAGIIRDSGHHLLDVVNTLLDVSKIESGNFAFSPEPFGLAELAEGCCTLMQIRADEAQINLVRSLPSDLPDISADRRACRQILINLLSNAIKFTPGGGRVSLAIWRDLDRLVLSVSDEGIGVGEADLPRLGDPFFQVGELHRRSHEGTGLGLSVVKGLVGLHGGDMTIESGPGLGTAVTIRLPIDSRAPSDGSRMASVRTVTRRRPVFAERKIA